MADNYTLEEIQAQLRDSGQLELANTIGEELRQQRIRADFNRQVKEIYGVSFSELELLVPPGLKLERRWAIAGGMWLSRLGASVQPGKNFIGGLKALALSFDNAYDRVLEEIPIPNGYRVVRENGRIAFRVPLTGEQWLNRAGSVLDTVPSGPDKRRIIVVPAVPERLLLTYTKTTTPGPNAIRRNGVFYDLTSEVAEG